MGRKGVGLKTPVPFMSNDTLQLKPKRQSTSLGHQSSIIILALTWHRTYKLFASQAIERDSRTHGRHPNAQPTPLRRLPLQQRPRTR